MPANFRPEMSVIKDLKPFKFWCSKVLPTVYDDSLSYYELLTKVLRYLNDTMESVEALDGNVNNIYNAYLLLEDYVNNYFDNADFQQMVNDKLDAMAEDGTLTTLITTYVDPLFDQMTEDLDTAIENQNTLIDGRFNTQDTRLGVMESQMNEFIADHAGPVEMVTLFNGYADAQGTQITLSDSPSNYEFIEVYYAIGGADWCPNIFRFPAESFHVSTGVRVNVSHGENDAVDKRLHVYSLRIIPADSVNDMLYTINQSSHWLWDGDSSSDALNYANSSTDSTQEAPAVLKIVGVRNSQNDAEIVNARIGANNTTYTTLGDAIRSQVTNLQNGIYDRAQIAMTSTSDEIDFEQGGNGAITQVSVPSMSKFNSEISSLESAISSSEGMSVEFKQALENLVNHVIFDDDDPTGQTYIDALHTAMYPPATLSSISVVYTQSGPVYNTTPLDNLRPDLVVNAHYSNGTVETVSTYVLSGSLVIGTSTVTVSYGGKTATFDVVVSENTDYTPADFAIGTLNTGTTLEYLSGDGYRLCTNPFALYLPAGSYSINCTTGYNVQYSVYKFTLPNPATDYDFTVVQGTAKTIESTGVTTTQLKSWVSGTNTITSDGDANSVYAVYIKSTTRFTDTTLMGYIRSTFRITKIVE